MLGVWVRDDLAGVGTLTYYKADGTYAALGHAVSDSDTGTIMSMAEGYLYHTDIVGIKKGSQALRENFPVLFNTETVQE